MRCHSSFSSSADSRAGACEPDAWAEKPLSPTMDCSAGPYSYSGHTAAAVRAKESAQVTSTAVQERGPGRSMVTSVST